MFGHNLVAEGSELELVIVWHLLIAVCGIHFGIVLIQRRKEAVPGGTHFGIVLVEGSDNRVSTKYTWVIVLIEGSNEEGCRDLKH